MTLLIPDEDEDDRDVRNHFAPPTLDEALAWVRKENCTLHNDSYFPSIEEA